MDTSACKTGLIDGKGWMDGWMVGWLDGWTYENNEQ